MEYTLEQFEECLMNCGLTREDLDDKQQFIRDWYYETEDMTLYELVEDFIQHFDLDWRTN
jgi:hypothetical protein